MENELWCPLKDMKKERLWYAIVTRDRHGKVVARERRKSHSFVKQWNQVLYTLMAQSVLTGILDTGGVPRNIDHEHPNMRIATALGNDSQGIRVGTGNTPVAIDDYALETPCDEGVGAGEMEHLVCAVDDFIVAAPSCSFGVHRTIVNNSPGIITVREAAIYIGMGTVFYALGIRDVLVAPQAVPVGGGITIDWTIGVTV